MPAIYRGKCRACAYQSPLTPARYLALRVGVNEFEPLPHPCESSTLEQLGYTWKRAKRERRLVAVDYLICDRCGNINEQYRAIAHQSCPIVIGGLILSCTACLILLPINPIGRIIAAWVIFWLFGKQYEAYCDRQAEPIQRSLPSLELCDRCNSTQFHPLSSLVNQQSICPACGARELKYYMQGIS